MSQRFSDTLALASLMALTTLFAWRFVDFSVPPFEDAAMLMRYADHVAQGKGIVWNIGEAPVDGATDFLFMLVVALLHRIGASLEAAVRLTTILSHFGTVALIYLGMRTLQGSGIFPAFLTAAYFAVGPGLFLSAAYFGTPFFAFTVAAAWLLAQRIIFSGGGSVSSYLVFSLMCLTVGLIRPEGALISVFMLIAAGVAIPFREFRRLTIVFGAIFLGLGGTYFIWRWHYFGYPLPNPFYKKGGGHFYTGSLRRSIQNSYQLLYPFIPAFLLSVRRRRTMRLGIAFLVPIAGSIGMWVLISDEMNFGARFQYPTLAICALSWFPLVNSIGEGFSLPSFRMLPITRRLPITLAAALVLTFIFAAHVHRSAKITNPIDGRYHIGLMLSDYASRGYTIVTTEAGLLPLYSRWRAVDTWGLNDQWIAHHGEITDEYLSRQQPDLIMLHGGFTPSPERRVAWLHQVTTLLTYAERHNYTLAAVFGISPQETHNYYVRSDLPESAEIVGRIRSTEYAWFRNGKKCENYAHIASHPRQLTGPESLSETDVISR